MKGIKEAFIDAGEISQMLGIGMTKAYAIIKEYNAELEAKGYFTMRGKCPRKYFEQKIYGYEDYYNPDYEPQRNRSKVAEEMDYEAAVGDSVISEHDAGTGEVIFLHHSTGKNTCFDLFPFSIRNSKTYSWVFVLVTHGNAPFVLDGSRVMILNHSQATVDYSL